MGVDAFQKLFGDAIKALRGAVCACEVERDFADGFCVDVFHVARPSALSMAALATCNVKTPSPRAAFA